MYNDYCASNDLGNRLEQAKRAVNEATQSAPAPEHVGLANELAKELIQGKMLRPVQIIEVLEIVRKRAMEYYQDRIMCAQKELEVIRNEAEPLFR